jgi:TolA-binding protein
MRRALLLLALLLPGCWVSSQHGDLIDSRLRALEADSQDHQTALEAQKKQLAELPKLDQKLQELSDTLEKVNRSTHLSCADVSARLDDLTERFQQLQGQLDEAKHHVDQLVTGEQAVASDVDHKLAAALGPQAMAQIGAKEKAMKLAPADRAGLYAVAFQQYKASAFDVARELFFEYLRRYPSDAQAGEAEFYAGDCLLQGGQFKQAALAFQKVTDQYGKSPVVCDARLKLGDSFGGLKMREEAKLAYEDTLKHCGGKLALAKQAKQKILELSKGAHHPKR